ncbi:MAG: glucose-6-phosphate 1-dehydrogenase [Mycobacterium sp.]|nr:glucose-6-phosphate 1-dehydrogenase [Mycobacterium sp.]
MADDGGSPSDLLVIFGITGDLARNMTFRALYRLESRDLLDCPILGVASDDMSVDKLIDRARKSITESGEKIDDAMFDRLASRLDYVHGDVTDSELYDSLAELIGSDYRPLYYLEMPPALFAPIVENLGHVGLLERARVAVEKPFGHDLESARELNTRLRAVLDEVQILRVDHFLGKQPVVELEYLRFANRALAELWDRDSISEIHITMAEDFCVEDRGKCYDAVGALRDVVQNHLLQVLALIAMEPPVGSSADDLNDKKAEVFRAMSALDPQRCVRGQYRGFTKVAGVANNSQTETFVALRTEIDNWRWAGVPIFLRAGKALPERVTEVRLFLRRVPYERLLYAGLTGDRQLFAREDSIEETWRIVQPLLDEPGEMHPYDSGSWGPEAAQSLLRGHRSWQQPWLPRNVKDTQ